ncbi:restriction endonuclease subunit S [Rothia mucilaginosa]|uniref:restriction endonuclease subunit S n=1 Tax=Rothia mucilaginosa TaxID=43675 RepID=UPI0028F0EAD0|nr:restriction endonuclease subunit S [Rothia mucilaginosa]
MVEVTNYIDRLVAELCPDGVEFYPIEELFTTRNGYTPSKSNSSYWENGTVPWFRMEDIRENGGILSESLQSVHESALKKGGMFPAGSIIVATSATIGEHALITVDFLCNQRFTVLILKDEFKSLLSPKFLYYYSFILDRWCLANTTQSSFASVDMKRFKKFEFPVPPMEIQEAIVEILDKFTNLEAELEAELEARTLQYEYYRDSLFEALDCPHVPLGELGKFYGGLKGKTKNDFGSSGARYISYKNVYENISADFTWPDFVQVKEGENQLSLMKGDILLTGSSENMEESGLSSVVTKEPEEKAYLNSFSICYRLNDPSILNPEFSKYLFRSRLARKQIIRTAQGVTRFNVSKKKLANVSIPIPSLEEQQRIVDILDRFDALTSSLSEGLPAELAARRSQYEYYRDQLLTFPRKGENQ